MRENISDGENDVNTQIKIWKTFSEKYISSHTLFKFILYV